MGYDLLVYKIFMDLLDCYENDLFESFENKMNDIIKK